MQKHPDFQTKFFERASYQFYFVGQLISYGIMTSFLTLFMTESGIPAFVVSAVLIVAKVWDAINDPLFGVIVDKSHLKGGKYLPWVRLSTVLIAVTTILAFAMPQTLGIPAKTAWILVAYLLWDLAYTMCDVPIFALATVMTDNLQERDSMYVLKGFFTYVGGLIVLIALPLMYPAIGWSVTVIILSALGMAFMLPIGFTAKERHQPVQEKEPSIKELFSYLLSNRPLLIFNGASIIACLTATGGTVANYVAIYCLGGEQWISYLTILMIVPMIISIFVVQILIKKVDKFIIYVGANVISILCSIILYFVGYSNIIAVCVIIVIKTLLTSGAGVTGIMFTADCAEYGHFKTGTRAQGMAFSVQTFTAKVTGALSGSIGMFLLGLVGFVEGSGAVQSPDTIRWIWLMWTLIPVISLAAAILLIVFGYKLPTEDAKLMAKCNAGEISREEALAGFRYKGYGFEAVLPSKTTDS